MEMINDERLILIGSSGRNSGKTTLAVELVRRLKTAAPVVGLKVTSVETQGGACPRGGAGCGACSLNAPFAISEECTAGGGKDTSRLLAAGARNVFWLRSLRSALPAAYDAFKRKLDVDADANAPIVVCESNSLRLVVRPAVFVMLRNDDGEMKPSAQGVADRADIVIHAPFRESDVERVLRSLPLQL
jgi:molybdopterin-guanine dinucleotide biosynthesis protein